MRENSTKIIKFCVVTAVVVINKFNQRVFCCCQCVCVSLLAT